MLYEYKVLPAPEKGKKAKGLKTSAARAAAAAEDLINELAAERWEYCRSDTLPVEERQGLTGKTTVFKTVLVFRRGRDDDPSQYSPQVMAARGAPEGRSPLLKPKEN